MPRRTVAESASLRSLVEMAASRSTIPDLWAEALRVVCLRLGADAGIGMQLTGDDRMHVAGSFCWPTPLPSGEVAVAPDSQAAFVLGSDETVVIDLATERRCVPSKLVADAGFRTSCSVRMHVGDTTVGLLAVEYRDRRTVSSEQQNELSLTSSLLGLILGQREELDLNAQLVDHDALTGLLNRRGVFDVLSGAVARQEVGCLLLFDLDDFKLVNDHHGHGVGDHVLQVVSDRLRSAIRPTDAVGRLSGDEFVVLLRDIDLGGALEVAERTIGHIEQVIAIPHATVSISASVGVATIADQQTVLALIQAADAAMYAAKTAGRGQALAAIDNHSSPGVATADVAVAHDHASSFGLADIDSAIAGLGVVFQPIVDAFTLQVTGLEALTRGPVGPLENPAALFRIAETWGRLTELELAAKRLTFGTPVPADLTLYVNIDPAALTSPGFLQSLIDEWNDSPHAGRDLVVELTERHLRSQPGRLLHAVEQCRSAGWKVALDDVGARAESLTALGFVEPDVIKLDMALINTTNPWHLAATTVALASYCENRAIEVIAEGIEDEDHARVAIELGSTHLQGFLYGRPAGIADFSTSADGSLGRAPAATRVRPAHRRARRQQLVAISRHIEGLANHTETVILAALQHVGNYSPVTKAQYAALARRCGTVGIVAAGASPGVRHGVHHGTIQPDDDLVNCWQVVLVHPEGGVALLARQVDPDSTAWYDYEITTERSRVNAAARRLLRQL